MPNRIIRERARTSETLALLSHGAERTFWRQITVADDYGRFEADPRVIRAQCYPLMLEKVTLKDVSAWLEEWVTTGLAECYVVASKRYGVFKTWSVYQRIRAAHSKFPAKGPSAVICQQMTADDSSRAHPLSTAAVVEVENRESKSREKRRQPAPRSGAAPRSQVDLILPAPEEGGPPVFRVADEIMAALDKCPRLGKAARLREPAFWQAMIRGHENVDFPKQLLKAEAWMTANPDKAPTSRLADFTNRWFSNPRAQEEQ